MIDSVLVERRRRRGWLCAALLALSALVLAACSGLDERQREWIFQPSERAWPGSVAAAEGMDDVWITHRPAGRAEPVRLHGLWLAGARGDAPVALYLHGARWNVEGSAYRARRLHELGFAVLSIDYRGFGQSTNELPSEDSAAEDALAAWQWLAERVPSARRFIAGHSLGGAIAVRLAAGRDDVAGLLLEGTFTSIPEVVSTLRFGWLPLGPLITQRFDSASRIAQVKAPVLVVHGASDRVIAPALGRALYERANAPKRFVLVEGGSHHSALSVGMNDVRQAFDELFALPAAQISSAQATGLAPSAVVSTAGAMPTR